jgi:hypothetical protein
MTPVNPVVTNNDVEAVLARLLAYCKANEWAGYDPYDALNNKLFTALPFLNSKLPRIALTQALKRSPINLRRIMLIPKTQNPKAIALFLSAFLKLSKVRLAGQEDLDQLMVDRLIALRSPGVPYWCWGYSFPWQTRTHVVSAGAPNLVCTTFCASALLDVYEQRGDSECLSRAVSAAEYLLNELYWEDGGRAASFSYPLPAVQAQVHNANFLAAALLCRVYKHTRKEKFLIPALKVARYSAGQQNADGSWYYGEAPSQRWIDNFHTGYNLCALRSIGNCAQVKEFESKVKRGFEFYRAHFFREDAAPRYFHNRTYPLDIHCVAQSIITLLEFKDFDPGNLPLALSVFQWAMNHMWDKRGFFYYRVLRLCTIRTPYMRWSEAWMLLALSTLLCEAKTDVNHKQTDDASAFVKA